MSNEVVKYNNDFNNQALRNFSSEELNLLMTIFHKLRDQSINILEYSFSSTISCVKSSSPRL